MSSEEAETTAKYEAETIDEEEQRARQELQRLVAEGKAQPVLNVYHFCRQSCDYVYGIVWDVAHDESLHMSEDVKAFARNLLDDWSK